MTSFMRGTAKATVAAVHEMDLEVVLGRPMLDPWKCSGCGNGCRGLPSAWIKSSDALQPLCMTCLAERSPAWAELKND